MKYIIRTLIFLFFTNANAQIKCVELSKEIANDFCTYQYFYNESNNYKYLHRKISSGNGTAVNEIIAINKQTSQLKSLPRFYTETNGQMICLNDKNSCITIKKMFDYFLILHLKDTQVLKLDSINLRSYDASFYLNDSLIYYTAFKDLNDKYFKLYQYNINQKTNIVIDSINKATLPRIHKIKFINNSLLLFTESGIMLYDGNTLNDIFTKPLDFLIYDKVIDGKMYATVFTTDTYKYALLASDGTKSGTKTYNLSDFYEDEKGNEKIEFIGDEIYQKSTEVTKSGTSIKYYMFDRTQLEFVESINLKFSYPYTQEMFPINDNKYLILTKNSKAARNEFDFSLLIKNISNNDSSKIQLPNFDDSLLKANRIEKVSIAGNYAYLELNNSKGTYDVKNYYKQFVRADLKNEIAQVVQSPYRIQQNDTVYSSDSMRWELKTKNFNNICQTYTLNDSFYFFNYIDSSKIFTINVIREAKPTFIKNYSLNNDLTIYPNPSNGKIFLDANYEFDNACLYDVNGRKIKEVKINKNIIDFDNIENGMYLIQLKGNVSITKMIIIQK